MSLEEALTRLDALVEEMEDEGTSLEASIALYKEGMGLSKFCNETLNRFEAEITLLQQEADGSVVERPIDA